MSEPDLRGYANLIIEECKRHGLTLPQCAYVLATAWHETAHTMKPVTEYGSQRYLRSKKYWPFIGRGFVQLTWRHNYARAGRILRIPLVKRPELANDPNIAARILVRGMKDGWFTGKKLSDYINSDKVDYVRARKIVNGLDRARLIARYARHYEDILRKQGYGTKEERELSAARKRKRVSELAAAWAAALAALLTALAVTWQEIVKWLFD